MKADLIANLLSFLVITALTGVVSFFLERAGLGTSNAVALWIVSLIILFAIFYSSRQRIWLAITRRFANIAIGRFSKKIGLDRVYDCFDDAAPDIKKAFEDATEARIFIQLGRGIVGGDRSLLFEAAQQKKGRGFKMRLLYADLNSPQLSINRANSLGSNYMEWTSAISYTEGSIQALLREGIQIEARRHCEPYLWRLFFFDTTLFFVPYLVRKDNDSQAPTFKFIINDRMELALYKPFSQYFEQMWEKYNESNFEVKKTAEPTEVIRKV